MSNSIREPFDTRILVADAIVSADPENGAVVLTFDGGEERAYSTGAACALAAALQAVAVHVMEQQPREIRRTTEPGQPEQFGIGGGL